MRSHSSLLRTTAVLAMALLTLPAIAAQSGKQQKTKVRRHVLSGAIASFDKDQQTLTLKTTKGETAFAVSGARVYVSSKSVGLEEIANEIGAAASVTYTVKDGQRAASSVRITPRKVKQI